MNRRVRLVAGTLALLALTFSFTESVLASTCAYMSEMASSVMSRHAGPSTEGGKDCLFGMEHGGRGGEDGHDGHHCPFAATMGPGCIAAPSIPTAVMTEPPVAGEATALRPTDADRPILLLVTTPFHPPRA